MLRLLWLRARAEELGVSPGLVIVPGQELLEEMWHGFVLFTAEYERFCVSRFGRVVHHHPTTRDDPPLDDEALHRYVALVFDELGEAAATRLFRTYPRRYTPEFLDAHRVPYARRESSPPRRSLEPKSRVPERSPWPRSERSDTERASRRSRSRTRDAGDPGPSARPPPGARPQVARRH